MTSAVGDFAPRPSRARRVIGLLVGLLVVAFLAAAIIGGWGSVTNYEWRFEPLYLVGAGIALVGSLGCTAVGYLMILERLSQRRLPRLRLASIWSRSMLARYVPGNVLMVAGRVVLGREVGVSGRVSMAATVYEQVFLLGISAVVGVGVLAYVGNLGHGPWLWIVAAGPLGLVTLHPRVFGPLSSRLLRRVGREPLQVLLTLREVAGFLLLYSVGYGCLGLGVWATVRGLAGPEADGPLLVGAGFLLSFVVSMLAFVFPSGLGIREGVFALILARALPGGVALAAAGATRIILTLSELGFAGVVVGLERWRRGRGAPLEEVVRRRGE